RTLASGRGVLQLLPQDRRIQIQLLCNLFRQGVAHDSAGYALHVRQKIIYGSVFALGAAHWELRTRSLNQVIEVFVRVLERVSVSILPFAPHKEVGIESRLECD